MPSLKLTLLFFVCWFDASNGQLPSSSPSAIPSGLPSADPSASADPTTYPSDAPSAFPSMNPSDTDSQNPTDGSSTSPSVLASAQPSFSPSSADPSAAPSVMVILSNDPTAIDNSPIPTSITIDESSPAPSAVSSPVPTGKPTTTSTGSPTISLSPTIPQQCSAYAACAGLVDDCCPTKDDIFLYCCFEPENPGKYEREFTLVNSQDSSVQAEYFVSTSTYFDPGTSPAPDGEFPVISYVTDPNELYDMIYYKTAAIANANDYVSGAKKFYIDLYSKAPPCTQIIFQLDSLPSAKPDNYPIGRHSRYLATTTKQNEWERLEFDFLDRPDSVLGDDVIDSFALFFNPGLQRSDSYYFRNLDSATSGCTNSSVCEQPATKSCSALYTGEEGSCDDGIDNDNDSLVDCEDSECTLDLACATSVRLAYASVKSQARSENGGGSGGVSRQTGSIGFLFSSIILLLASTAITTFLN